MGLLVDAIKDFCRAQGLNKTYWLAYSGGLDSHVLLHLFASVRSEFPFKLNVVHVNHGLSANASDWSKHCGEVVQEFCHASESWHPERACWMADSAGMTISFLERSIQINPAEKNLEESARDKRYDVFAELLAPNDVLLTAHHQDDQAETVLLQMLRGAGPKGLSAMPQMKSFAKGFHARPLLDFSRNDLKIYAEKNHLHWIDDESNENTHFTRNFLRHEVMPILKQRWPSIAKTLSRVADNCAEAQELLDGMGKASLLSCQPLHTLSRGWHDNGTKLSIKQLLEHDPATQRHILRTWLQESNHPIPSAIKLQQIQQDMLHAREDKTPHIAWSGIELRRYRDELYVMPCLPKHDPAAVHEWDLSQPLTLPNIGILRAEFANNTAQCLHPDIKTVSVRFRNGGETFQLPDRKTHHDLKKLFQDWGIPPWLRNRIPLVFVNEMLAAVVGVCVGEEFVAKKNDGYLLQLGSSVKT